MEDIIYFDGEKFAKLPPGEPDVVLPEKLILQWYIKILKLLKRMGF